MAKNKNIPWIIAVIILVIINLIIAGLIVIKLNNAESNIKSDSENIQNINSTDLIIGNTNAKVTITEYTDFECPYCKKFYTGAYAQIKTEYVDTGKVKIVVKHFPLTNIHQNALSAAIAVECAREENKGPQMHDKVYTENSLTNTNLKAYAKELGLNSEKFDSCLDTQKYKDKVMKDQATGASKGVSGTPTLFVGEQKLVGAQPFNVFQTAIEKELAK